MSEPRTRATELREPVPGLLHWTVLDERIDFRSEAYALYTAVGLVIVDPLPVDAALEHRLRGAHCVVLTGAFHQRAAWSFRRILGVPVLAPREAVALDESPDGRFDHGDELAPGLSALDRPGPNQPHFAFVWRRPSSPFVLFCGDLLMRGDGGAFAFVPDDHQDDPRRSRESVRLLATESFDVLCPAHGHPAIDGGKACVERALRDDGLRSRRHG